MSFGPSTVTVLKRGEVAKDAHNNPVVGTVSTFDLVGVFIQQRASVEEEDARHTTETTWLLIGPPPPDGQTIDGEDLIRLAASISVNIEPDAGETFATFELAGEADPAQHITGAVHHTELTLRRYRL